MNMIKNINKLLTKIFVLIIFIISPCYAQKTMLLEIGSTHMNYDGPGDPVGEQVVQNLKKLITKSNFFKITSEQKPRLKVIIHTFDPLSQSNHLFTVFSYIFVYINKQNMMPTYVMSAMGYAHRDDVRQAAEKLNNNIHKIAYNLIELLEVKR